MFKSKLRNILIFSLIGAIVLTYASTFYYSEEIALTTAGEFSKKEALRMDLKTNTYYGWPSTILWGGLGIPKVSSPIELIGYIPAYIFYFTLVFISLVPNLLFWGLVSFLLASLYYTFLKLLQKVK